MRREALVPSHFGLSDPWQYRHGCDPPSLCLIVSHLGRISNSHIGPRLYRLKSRFSGVGLGLNLRDTQLVIARNPWTEDLVVSFPVANPYGRRHG